MQFLKKNIWTLATMALIVFVGMIGDAAAQGTSASGSCAGRTEPVSDVPCRPWYQSFLYA